MTRPEITWTFTVLDSQETNAFALPGGYIYITRGIMSYLNSEAELAAVLGHEIGHVTARHAVRQQTGATAAGVGATLIAVLTGSGEPRQHRQCRGLCTDLRLWSRHGARGRLAWRQVHQ